jgi:DNA-directed RNA polymerase
VDTLGLLPPPLAGEGWGGGGRDGGCDCLQHASSIGHDVEIAKAQNAESFLDKKGVPARVALDMLCFEMLAAIEFDHQACGVTDKINDIWTNGRLSTKACAVHAMGT